MAEEYRERTLIATFWHTESNRREEKAVTIRITPEQEKFVIVKLYVVELDRELVFDKETNEFLVPD